MYFKRCHLGSVLGLVSERQPSVKVLSQGKRASVFAPTKYANRQGASRGSEKGFGPCGLSVSVDGRVQMLVCRGLGSLAVAPFAGTVFSCKKCVLHSYLSIATCNVLINTGSLLIPSLVYRPVLAQKLTRILCLTFENNKSYKCCVRSMKPHVFLLQLRRALLGTWLWAGGEAKPLKKVNS